MNIKTIGLYTLISIFCLINTSLATSLLSGIALTENDEGVVVIDVKSKTALEQAGIERGDIIQKIEGEQISTLEDYLELSEKIKTQNMNQVKIVFKRKDTVIEKTVKHYVAEITTYKGTSNDNANNNDYIEREIENINTLFSNNSITPAQHVESIAQNLIKHINSNPNFAFPQWYAVPRDILNKLDKIVFLLTSSQEINAWTDSKAVYIATGTFSFVNSDSELALVLAHELAHIIKHHHGKRVIGTFAATTMSSISNVFFSGLGDLVGYGSRFLLLKYDRGQELEADALALQIINKAGYDLDKAIAFHEKIDENMPAIKTFLSTHPSSKERVANLKQLASKIKHSQPILKSNRLQSNQ